MEKEKEIQKNQNLKKIKKNKGVVIKPKTRQKRISMKLSLLRFKIAILFIVLFTVLSFATLFYENKTYDYQVYLNGKATEYVGAEEEQLKNLPLSIVKALDAYTFDVVLEEKTAIIMPNNNLYIVDYVTKTIVNKETLEKVEGEFLGEGLNNVIIDLETLKEMGDFTVKIHQETKSVEIYDNKEFTISEKLSKQEKYSYFNPKLIVEYFDKMKQNPEMQSKDAIIEVNEGLYRPFYQDTEIVSEPESKSVMINKYFQLPSTYKPIDLVDKGDGRSLRTVAYNALDDVVRDMRKEGLDIYLISAYRSYSRQEYLYNRYVSIEGQEYADISSARPGFSEHQTGLAMDILQVSGVARSLSEANFQDSQEYQWLLENAYKYGLILRYPKGEEDITGYMYEPWHWRYVGEDIAMFMHQNDIKTFEEFNALRGASEEKFPQLDIMAKTGESFLQRFVNEENVQDILAYKIEGLNYYNLVDISRFTNESKFQFKVIFEENNGLINLILGSSSGLGKAYTEISDKDKNIKSSIYDMYIDNFIVSTTYPQYVIDDEIYISLVDLNTILGFDIEWNYTTNSFEFRR